MKADKETAIWRYELEPAGTGIQGSYQIKVWSYSKKAETAIEQAKKNAVHGIIFGSSEGFVLQTNEGCITKFRKGREVSQRGWGRVSQSFTEVVDFRF